MLSAIAILPLVLPTQEAARPNVLLITVDDLNDWVGALGGQPQARTPNIDALSARGVVFTNAHCQAPVCTPSRASLFTGRLPSTTGVYFLQPALAQVRELDGVTTLLERFAADSYETLGVGKLHHGSGEARYFDEYGGDMGGFGPLPEERLSYPQGHRLWDWGAYPETDASMPDSKVADWAVAKLGEERGEPFFLAVGFWRPHVPMCVPEPWFEAIGREQDVRLPEVLSTDRDDLPRYATELTIGYPAPRHEWLVEHDAWRGAVHAYLASSCFADAQVGRVLRALQESAHADDTIVVLLSDHGFHLGEKQRWAKRSLWEESTRVPLIIAGPGIAPARCDAPVGLVDLYPTLLELCGLEAPHDLDGHSLARLCRDPTASWPHAAITSFGPGNHAVRTRHWRYIRYADGSEELYDHRADPNEWHNLAGRDGHDERLAELRAFVPDEDATPVANTSGPGLDAMRAAEAATGAPTEPSRKGPVKVFILAGQSNMEGAGAIRGDLQRNGGKGGLEHVVRDPATADRYKHLVDEDGEWVVRDDVWIWYFDRKGELTVGYGAQDDRIGPELEFGHVVGDHYGDQVLLIKVAWGGKSLAKDFRPPSSGGELGPCYKELFEHVRDVLDSLETHFAHYDGQGYEIVGLGWHQGWNDRVNQAYNDAYERNLAGFIRDAREELSLPRLPFVIAETGMSGHGETHPRALSLMRAQAAVVQHAEFVGNVAFVATKDFYRPPQDSPSNQSYHWNSNAETYLLIGHGMGKAMIELADRRE